MLPENKVLRKKLRVKIAHKKADGLSVSRIDIDFLDACIGKEIKRWVNLKSYWNIKVLHLVDEFKNHYTYMTTLSKIILLDEFESMLKDMHEFRIIKIKLMEIYASVILGEVPDNGEIILSVNGQEIVLSVADKTLLTRYEDPSNTKNTIEYISEFSIDDLFG